MRKIGFSAVLLALLCSSALGQLTNKPEQEEAFMDMGFGVFIH
ncbi:hypothetical protein ACFL6U_00595 [Planctomycetota bacterium]